MNSPAQKIAPGVTGLAIPFAPRPVEPGRCYALGLEFQKCMGASLAQATIQIPQLVPRKLALRIVSGVNGPHGLLAPRSVAVVLSPELVKCLRWPHMEVTLATAPATKRQAATLTFAL